MYMITRCRIIVTCCLSRFIQSGHLSPIFRHEKGGLFTRFVSRNSKSALILDQGSKVFACSITTSTIQSGHLSPIYRHEKGGLFTRFVSRNSNCTLILDQGSRVFACSITTSIYCSCKTQQLVECPDENLISESTHISVKADKLCQTLANLPVSDFESFLNCSAITLSPALVEEVLRRLSNSGVLALTFFRWAEKQTGFKPTTEGFHILIESLAKIKQFSVIWKLVDIMASRRLLTRETFLLIIRRYSRARKIKEALCTFEKMGKFGLQPQMPDFNRLIDALCKTRHVEKAEEFFYSMKEKGSFLPDHKSYTILLEGWGHENLFRMEHVYQEMKNEGFDPDIVTYGVLMDAYCKSGKLNEAVMLLKEMENKNIRPNAHTYCILINGFGTNRKLHDALTYFQLSRNTGSLPEIPTYNAVVGAYCCAAQFDNAFKVLDGMMRSGLRPNSRTYDIIIQHLIRAGRREEAYCLFKQMSKEFGCEPGLNTYSMMLAMLCLEESLSMALQLWKQMKANGVIPCMHVYCSLINELCERNELEVACNYFHEMMDMGIRPPGQLYGNLKQALLMANKQDLWISLSRKLDVLRNYPLAGY